jgi:hypothetical protein
MQEGVTAHGTTMAPQTRPPLGAIQPQEPQLFATNRPSPAILADGQRRAPESSATTPQIAESTQPSRDEKAMKNLPGTSSYLPLIALLGLLSLGTGMLLRWWMR